MNEKYKGFDIKPVDGVDGWYEYESFDKKLLGSKESLQEAKDYIDEILELKEKHRVTLPKRAMKWCPDCASNHITPTTKDQHRMLQCEAPYEEPKMIGQDE